MKKSVLCPAKINLGLRVGGRGPDGYHEIRTVFQTIAIYDRLTLEVSGGGAGPARVELFCNVRGLSGDANLAARAARAILDAMRPGRPGGLRVRLKLDKRIPTGAGLGGGSSDAAAVLRVLPALVGLRLGAARRREIAAALGADVPFFLVGGRALGQGRGTKLRRLPDPPPRPLLVVHPGLHVSTAEAYRRLDESRRIASQGTLTSRAAGNIMLGSRGLRVGRRGERLKNDFEPVVFFAYPELARLKAILTRAGASPALLSGSGSAMFGVFESVAGMQRAAAQVRKWRPQWRIWKAATVSRQQLRWA